MECCHDSAVVGKHQDLDRSIDAKRSFSTGVGDASVEFGMACSENPGEESDALAAERERGSEPGLVHASP